MTRPADTPNASPAHAGAVPLGRHLVVISGPSGAGKTTICRTVADRLGLPISVSATTRPRRRGETEGEDYRFVTDEEFDRRIDEGRFVEWAEVFGHRYGTPVEEVERARDSGDLVLLEIDVQGGIQIKRAYPDALAVLVVAPDAENLRRRLAGRGTESEEQIRRRLRKAADEVHMARESGCYDREIVNDRLEPAVRRVIEWVKTRRNQV